MSTRAAQFQARVARRESLTDHLVRLVLDGLDGFASTGVPDEWVGLVVPGQFQSRYYTVRSWVDGELTIDVVVHDVGLVTEWAMRDCVDDTVTITEPKASFDPPPGDTLSVDFDAYIQPSSQLGASGEVAVVEAGVPVVTVPFRTWLVP